MRWRVLAKQLPLEVVSKVLRARTFYRVEDAGALLGLGRTRSYQAAREGLIPTERYGARKLLLVRKSKWNAEVQPLAAEAAPAEASAQGHPHRSQSKVAAMEA